MKRILYIWMLALMCIQTVYAESVKFETYRKYPNQQSLPDQNQFKAAYAIQSKQYVKIDLKSPSTYIRSVPVPPFGGNDYHLWLQTSQVEVTLLNAHAVIESIMVTYVTKIEDVVLGFNVETDEFTMNFPTGKTSHLFSFSQGSIKVNSITVNYHVNHEYGEMGAAYYTCQVCGQENEARKAACADRAMHLTAVGGDVTIGMKKTGNPADYLMQYSMDKQNWTTLTLTATTDIVTIPAGQTCYFRHGGDTPIEHIAGNQNNCWSFTMKGEGTIEAGGNVMSMLDIAAQKSALSDYPTQHAFTGLFRDCAKLTVAPELPATTIGQFCYMYMFAGTGITTAPALSATTIPDGAYYGMFQDCKNLTTVPALPGTSLSRVAYKDIFHGCEKLTSVEIANITSINSDNPFADWLTGTAVGTNGLLIAPNDMVGNAKVILPENWQYKQISDFITDIRQASEGLRGAMLDIATGYIRQVKEANSYGSAFLLRGLAIAELNVLQKCLAFKHDDYYTAPEGTGYRMQIVTNNDRTYEFQTKYINMVDYYQQGQAVQDDANALTLMFKEGTGMPIESEHYLQHVKMEFSSWGDKLEFKVNNAEVDYNLDNVSGLTLFNGTPKVQLHANQDPDAKTPSFYTTFYSGLEAYTLPEGVKAYTAEVSKNTVLLTPIEGDILPKGVAVLLHSNTTGEMVMTVSSEDGEFTGANLFRGVDVETDQDDSHNYMLSYGQYGLAFYKMKAEMKLSANKAFLLVDEPTMTNIRAFNMIFDEEETGIEDTLLSPLNGDEIIYNLNGVRLSKLQKGVNIVNGRKVIIK